MISAKQQRSIHKPLFWLAFTFAVVFLPAISGATSKLLESPSHPISLLSETEVQSLTSAVGHQKRAGLGMLPRAMPYIDAAAAAALFDEVRSEQGINDWPEIYWASREVGPLLESPELIQIRAKAKELSTAKEQVLATLRVHNIQVRGIWKVWDGEESLFSVRSLNGGGKGELLLTGTLTANKTYRVTVSVEDDFRYLNEDYQNLSVRALITIKVLSGQLSVLPVPRLTATAGYAGALHKLLVSGGQPPYAYTLSLTGFSVLGGMLSLSAETPASLYTVSVEIRDSGEPPLRTMAEVTVQVWETLSGDLASGFVQTTYVGESGILGRLSLVGGSGDYGYQLADDNGGQFGVGDAEVSVIMASTGVYTLSVIVTDGMLPTAAWPPATMVLSVWVEPSLRLLSLAPSSHLSVLATAAKDVVLLSVVLGGGRQFAGGGYQFVPPSPNVLGWSARGLGIEGAAFELSLTAALAGGAYTVMVMFSDDYDQHTQPGTPAVSVLLTIEGLPSLSSRSTGRTEATLIANVSMTSIYVYRAEGGVGALSYSYQGGQGFVVDSSSGVLAYEGDGDAGVYTLSVVVDDESALVPPLTLTELVARVSSTLSAMASQLTVDGLVEEATYDLGVQIIASGGLPGPSGYLYTVEMVGDGGGGSFEIDVGGNLRIKNKFTETVVVTARWTVNDGENETPERTPAVSGEVVVSLVSRVLFNPPFLSADITTGQHAAAVIFTVQAEQGITTAVDGYTYQVIDAVPSPMTLLASGLALLVSLTAAIESPQTLTLQIEVRDEATPPTPATMRLEVRVWDVLSGKLSDDFVRQTYQGEYGALGEVQIAGGSGDYLHTITAAGFEMDAAGRLVMDAAVNKGVYMLTIWSSDKLLSEQGWLSVGVLATVSVGAPFALAEWPRVLALQAGEDGEELLTLSAEGGAQPYTYNAVGLPAALTMSLSADNQQVFRRLSGGELLLGDNVATIVVNDGYVGPTTPGTGELTALVTIEGVANLAASLSLRVSVPSDFVGTVGNLSAVGGLGEVAFELQPSSVFALSGEHLLVTASLRGDANAALLTAHLRVRRGVETLNTLAVVAVSAALSLSWSAELSDVPAGYIGEVAQLAASGGYAGDLTYALLSGAGYQVEPTSGVVSISAAISGMALTASLVVWRGLEQSEAVVLSVRVGGALSVVLLSPLSLPLSLLSGRVEEGATLASWSLLAGKEPLSATLPGDAEGYGITLSSRRASLFVDREVFLSAGSRTLTVLFGDGYVNAGLSPSLAVELPLTVLSSLSGEASRSLVFAPLGVSSFPLSTEIVPQGGAGSYTISLSDSRFGVDASNHLVLVSAVSEVGTVSVVWLLDDGSDLTAPVSATIIVQFVEGSLFIEDMRVVHVTAGLLSDQIYKAEAFGGAAGGYTYIVLGEKPSALSFAAGVVGVSMALLANTTLRLTIEASDSLSHRATAVLAIKGYDVLSASVAQGLVLTIWTDGDYVLGTLLVSGGTGDYEFAVSPDDFMVNSDREIVSQGASSGVYTLTVLASDKILSDSGWVTAMVSLTVRVFDNLSLSAPSALTVVSQYTGALATLRASGGDGDYTFALSDSEIFALGGLGDEAVLSITAAQNGGAVHTLTITLQDKIGSPWSKATITIKILPLLSLSALSFSLTATAGVSGVIYEFRAIGGTGYETYRLLAEVNNFALSSGGTLSVLPSVTAGVVVLTVAVEEVGSAQQATAVLTVHILAGLSVAALPTLTMYAGAAAVLHTLLVSGGYGDYTYDLEGDNFLVVSGVLRAEQGLESGFYTLGVEVYDGSPMAQRYSLSVVVRVLPFAILVPSGVALDLVAGDVLVISIGGGEPPVSLSLAADTATIFALVGTTLRLQGESFLTGVYSLTIEAVDGGGNTATAMVSVILSRLAMKQVPLLYALVDKNSLYTVQATGGKPPYAYRREAGEPAINYFKVNSGSGVLLAGGTAFNPGVPEGEYYFTVVVQDATGLSSSVLVTASSSEWATVLVGGIEINNLPQTQFNPKTFEGITALVSPGSTVQIARKGSGGWEITLYGGGEMVFVKDQRNPLAAVVSVNMLGDLDVIQTDESWPVVSYYQVGDEAVRVEAVSPAAWHYRRFNGQIYLLLRGEVQMLSSQAEAVQIVPLSGAAAVHMTDGVGGTTLSVLSLLQEKVRRVTVLSDEVKILATLSAVNNFVGKITWSLAGSSPYITIDADSGVLSVTVNLLPNHDVLLLTVAMDDKIGTLRGLGPRRLLQTVEIIVSTGIRRDIFVVGGKAGDVWRLRNNEWVQTAEDFYGSENRLLLHQGFAFYQGQLYVSGGQLLINVNEKYQDMWSSADGITWNEAEPLPYKLANHVMVVHKGKMLIFGGGRSDVWSFNGEGMTQLSEDSSVQDVDSAAEHLGILYAAEASSSDVWRTLDGGKNWRQVAGTLRFDTGEAGEGHLLSDDKWLYFIGDNAKVWRSVDGVAWSVVTSDAAFGSLDCLKLECIFRSFFAFAGTEGLYVGEGGSINMWQSVDEGLTWEALPSTVVVKKVGLEVMPPPVYPLSIYSPPSELTIFNVAGAVATLWSIGGDYDYNWSVADKSGHFQINQDGVLSLLDALSADYHVLTITAKVKDGRQEVSEGVSHVIVIELKEKTMVAGATGEVETTGAVATLTAWYGYGAVSYELLREPPFFAIDARKCQERCVVIDDGTARSYGVAG